MRYALAIILLIALALPFIPFAAAQDGDGGNDATDTSSGKKQIESFFENIFGDANVGMWAVVISILSTIIIGQWLSLKIIFGHEATLTKTILFMIVSPIIMWIVIYVIGIILQNIA